ncbi:hypothetical protein BTZ20_1062 [Rhodococcus sp. MTM3W5.2]|nr:hypothetical protein BTZ20_1062 [Rhodococcus sp. MTM3W5.2]
MFVTCGEGSHAVSAVGQFLEDHMGSISTIISLFELYQLLSQFS